LEKNKSEKETRSGGGRGREGITSFLRTI
jgi:hypothetical protein